MECLAHLFAQDQIVVVHGIVSNGLKLGNIHLAVLAQDRFVHADIDDLTTRRQDSSS